MKTYHFGQSKPSAIPQKHPEDFWCCIYTHWCSWHLDTSPNFHLLKYYHPEAPCVHDLHHRVMPDGPSIRCDRFCFWIPTEFYDLVLKHVPHPHCILAMCEMFSPRFDCIPGSLFYPFVYSTLFNWDFPLPEDNEGHSERPLFDNTVWEHCLHPCAAEEVGSILANRLTALFFRYPHYSLFSHRMISIRLPHPRAILFS